MNQTVYDYTDADIDKIFEAIEEQVRLVRSRFEEKRKVRFNL